MQVLEVGLELEAGLDAGVVSDAEAVPAEYLVPPRVDGAPSLRGHRTWCQLSKKEEGRN